MKSRGPRYDRAFEPAVQAGFISAYEAIARGNRQTYAGHLSQRFRISIEVALTVTDNHIRLHEAVQAAEKSREWSRPRRRTLSRPLKWQLVTLAVGSVILAGLLGADQWQRQVDVGRQLERLSQPAAGSASQRVAERTTLAGPPTVATPRTRVERDAEGRITRITASRPRDVLVALCDAATAPSSCASFELLPTRPPFPGRRQGVVLLSHPYGESRTLQIVRDRRSGRWFAGTGLTPIGLGEAVGLGDGAAALCEGSGYDCVASDAVSSPEAGAGRLDRS